MESSLLFVASKESEWSAFAKTVEKQILELNTEKNDGIEWELKDTQILPNWLSVVKINKSSFLKAFHFPSVKMVRITSKFQHSFTINTISYGINQCASQVFGKF